MVCKVYICSCLLEKKTKKSWKHKWKLLQSETGLTSSFQSANLTATVWARFSYRYLTTANYMLHIDNCLPFCCKFTINCNATSNSLNRTWTVHSSTLLFITSTGEILWSSWSCTASHDRLSSQMTCFFLFILKPWWHLPVFKPTSDSLTKHHTPSLRLLLQLTSRWLCLLISSHTLLQKQSSQLEMETKWALCLHLECLAAMFVQYVGIVNSIVPKLIEKTKPATLGLSVYSIRLQELPGSISSTHELVICRQKVDWYHRTMLGWVLATCYFVAKLFRKNI